MSPINFFAKLHLASTFMLEVTLVNVIQCTLDLLLKVVDSSKAKYLLLLDNALGASRKVILWREKLCIILVNTIKTSLHKSMEGSFDKVTSQK